MPLPKNFGLFKKDLKKLIPRDLYEQIKKTRNINVTDEKGRTAFTYLMKKARKTKNKKELSKIQDVISEMLETLGQKNGLKFRDKQDKLKWSLLHWAVYRGNAKVVKNLLDVEKFDERNLSSKDILRKDEDGRNVFHLAVEHGEIACLKEILKSKSSRKALFEPDNDGETPLDMAIEKGNNEIIELFQIKLKLSQNDIELRRNKLKASKAPPLSLSEEGITDPKKESVDRTLTLLEKRLRKRLKINDEARISTRDIFVSQMLGKEALTGEFEVAKNRQPPAPDEPTDSVIERIEEHISKIAELAKKQHLADNFISESDRKLDAEDGMSRLAFFDDKNKKKFFMRPDAENNITRLFFNEFSFYPSKTHGPFTLEDFKLITEKLVKIGKTLPANMQLVLGSFPVIDDNDNVRNVVCHIQCFGDSQEPLITNFVKATPSVIDPVYPRKGGGYYKNPYLGSGSDGHVFRETVDDILKKIISQLEIPLERKKLEKLLEKAIKLSHSRSDISARTMVETLNKIKTAMQKGATGKEVIELHEELSESRILEFDDEMREVLLEIKLLLGTSEIPLEKSQPQELIKQAAKLCQSNSDFSPILSFIKTMEDLNKKLEEEAPYEEIEKLLLTLKEEREAFKDYIEIQGSNYLEDTLARNFSAITLEQHKQFAAINLLKSIKKKLEGKPSLLDSELIEKLRKTAENNDRHLTELCQKLDSVQRAAGLVKDQVEAVCQDIDHYIENVEKQKWYGGWHYGGNLQCITQGGIEFTSVLDICVEHTCRVAKRSYMQNLEQERRWLEKPRSQVIAHSIVSNTISPSPANILGSSYAHADVRDDLSGVGRINSGEESRVKPDAPEEALTLPASRFGYGAKLHISQLRTLDTLTGPLNQSALDHNELFVKIEALRLYANQHPQKLEMVNERLMNLIAETAIRRNIEKGFSLTQPKSIIVDLIKRKLAAEDVQISSPALGEHLEKAEHFLAEHSKKEERVKRNQELDRKAGSEHQSKPLLFSKKATTSDKERHVQSSPPTKKGGHKPT